MPRSKLNPYRELDVPMDATEQEIRTARKRRVRKAHPDVGGSAEEFHRVQTAALILLDPKRRRKYDEDGTVEDEEPVDKMSKQATELIFTFVSQTINEYVSKGMRGPDPRKRKLLFEYCYQANVKIVEMQNNVRLGERVHQYYLDMASRFTSERDKRNLLRRQMEHCARSTLEEIDEVKRQIAKLKMSVEICAMYDFRFDPEEFRGGVYNNLYSTTTGN